LLVFSVEAVSNNGTCLLVGDGPVFGATGHDQELVLFDPDAPVPEIHTELSLEDQEVFAVPARTGSPISRA
jgi:hypothetical protein